MSNIYEQHSAAFSNVSAFVVLDNKGTFVARVALKFPRDGAGRLYAYVHWFGVSMVRGFAGGYGYDKRSAAVENAVRKMAPAEDSSEFVSALTSDDGRDWSDKLRAVGFIVHQAV